MAIRPVVELGVSEAHAILAARPGADRLPPLEAIENEDWGRDLLLSRFEEMPPEELAALGLSLDDWVDEANPEERKDDDQSG